MRSESRVGVGNYLKGGKGKIIYAESIAQKRIWQQLLSVTDEQCGTVRHVHASEDVKRKEANRDATEFPANMVKSLNSALSMRRHLNRQLRCS